jgi:hypothetical protein
VAQLGRNADGEILEPGRVPDCYLGLRLDPAGALEPAGVLVVAPSALLHPAVPQPDGTVLFELVTGHPDRIPRELVFLADLTVELRAGPPTPGRRSAWTPTRSPRRSSAAGGTARSAVCRLTTSASRRPAPSPSRR